MKLVDPDVLKDERYAYDWSQHKPEQRAKRVPGAPKFWNDFRVESLRRLWRSGMTCVKIGVELGCTKNAVIGKADRIGLPRRDNHMHVVRKMKKTNRGKGFEFRNKKRA